MSRERTVQALVEMLLVVLAQERVFPWFILCGVAYDGIRPSIKC